MLTPRETEVLELITKGFTTREIAGMLYIGGNTVKTHRRSVMKKCGARNVADLMNKIELSTEKDILLNPGAKAVVANFCRQIVLQSDCPAEFKHVVNKQFWNLI